MTTLIVKKLANGSGSGEVLLKRIGEIENEMDPVAVLYPSDKSIAAVVFPIAETLNQVSHLILSQNPEILGFFIISPTGPKLHYFSNDTHFQAMLCAV